MKESIPRKVQRWIVAVVAVDDDAREAVDSDAHGYGESPEGCCDYGARVVGNGCWIWALGLRKIWAQKCRIPPDFAGVGIWAKWA